MSHTECLFLPLATKLRQGNIFTGASNSVHGGGGVWQGGAWQEGACMAGGYAWYGKMEFTF